MADINNVIRVTSLEALRAQFPGFTGIGRSNLAGEFVVLFYRTHRTDGQRMVCPRWEIASGHNTEQAAERAAVKLAAKLGANATAK